MNIIARLEMVRIEMGMNGKEIAKILKIDPNSYSSIKKGKRKLKVSELEILKDILRLNPIWLMFGDGDKYYDSKIQSSKLVLLINDAYVSYKVDADIEKNILSKIATIIIDKIYVNYQYRKNQGERFHYILFKILQNITYYTGRELTAKEDLMKMLHNFDDRSPNLIKVKNSLDSAITKLTTKDCYYILKNPEIYMGLVYQKISIDSKKMIENTNIILKPFYTPLKWFSKPPKI